MKKKTGHPKIEIIWKKVDDYLNAQCDGVGIAGLIGIAPDTLYKRCKEEKKMPFSVYAAQKKGEGKELLRQKQFQTAIDGNYTMMIWLGKQYLDQSDKQDTKQSGISTQINITVDSQKTADELKRLMNIPTTVDKKSLDDIKKMIADGAKSNKCPAADK